MSKIKSCFQILELKKYFGLVSTFMIFSLIIFSCESLDFKEKFNSKTTFEIKDFRNEDWSSIQKRKDTCNENLTATDTSVRLNNTIFNIKVTKKCLLDHNVIDSSRVYELNGGGKYVLLYNNYEFTINLKGEEFELNTIIQKENFKDSLYNENISNVILNSLEFVEYKDDQFYFVGILKYPDDYEGFLIEFTINKDKKVNIKQITDLT